MKGVETQECVFQDHLHALFKPQNKIQEMAWERFLEVGLPSTTHESYRFMRLRELYGTSFETSLHGSLTQEEVLSAVIPECRSSFLVFHNGVFSESLSCVECLPKGTAVLPFAKAQKSYGAFLARQGSELVKEETDPFVLLNAALATEGVFFYLPPQTIVEAPVQIIHWLDHPCAWSSPRLLGFGGKASSIHFFFKHVARNEVYGFNSVVDFTLEEGAHITCDSLTEGTAEAWHLEAIRATLKKQSFFKAVTVTRGAKAYRQDAHITFKGEEAEASLHTGWLLSQTRQAHFHALMDHQRPHCQSLQKFKGTLSGTSRSSFEGKIFVEKQAQKTSAYQRNNHLLLSERALAISRPTLEIFADDVKASHGATSAPLDAEELFYLKSRGLSEEAAKRLLLSGFSKEIIDSISLPSVRQEALFLAEKYHQ